MATAQQQYLDVYRQGLEDAVAMARTALDEAERLRLKQVEAIRAALAENAELGRQIANANSTEELFAAQTRFASHQVEVAFGYWGKLFEAASHAQLEAIRRIDQQAAQFHERFAALAADAPAGSEPFFGAMTSFLQAARTLYGIGAQASEQAAKLAEAQLGTATAGIRDALAGAAKKTA
jgi:phasin family protein